MNKKIKSFFKKKNKRQDRIEDLILQTFKSRTPRILNAFLDWM